MSENAATPSVRRKRLFGALGLVLLCCAIFGQTIGFDFVAWDDYLHLRDNPSLNPPAVAQLPKIWSEAQQQHYVPLSYTLWTLLALGAHAVRPEAGYFQPGVFHAACVALHCLNALLAWRLIEKLLTRVDRSDGVVLGAAWFGAALFAVHPLAVESAAWVSETRGLLSAAFLLAALLQHLAYLEAVAVSASRKAAAHYVLGCVLFAAALVSKPSAAAGPLLLMLLDAGCCRRSLRAAVVAALPWVIEAVLLWRITSVAQPLPPAVTGLSLLERGFVATDALGFYLVKSLWPWPLGIDYGRSPKIVLGSGIGYAWAPLAVLACVLVAGRSSRRSLAAAYGWFALALAPVLGLAPFQFQMYSTTADRYAYLSLIGVGWAGAVLMIAAWRRFVTPTDRAAAVGARAGVFAIGGAVLIAAATASFVACRPWQNTVELFEHALRTNPNSAAGLQGVAGRWFDQGDARRALSYLQPAFERFPEKTDLLVLGSSAYLQLNQLPEALDLAERAERSMSHAVQPRLAAARAQLRLGRAAEAREKAAEALSLSNLASARDLLDTADVLLGQGEADAARRGELAEQNVAVLVQALGRNDAAAVNYHLSTAARCAPDAACVSYARGRIAEATGDVNAALPFYQRAVDVEPRPEYLTRWGNALRATGRRDEARTVFERLVEIEPNSATAHNNLGAILAERDPAAARRHYEAALQLDPKLADVHNNLGNLAARSGQWQEAAAHYRAALELKPDLTAAQRNLEIAEKRSAGRP